MCHRYLSIIILACAISCTSENILSNYDNKSSTLLYGIMSPEAKISVGDKNGEIRPLLWEAGDEIEIVSEEDGQSLGVAQLISGAGTSNGMFRLNSKLTQGIRIRVFNGRRNNTIVASEQRVSINSSSIRKMYACSDVITVDNSTRALPFNFSPKLSAIELSIEPNTSFSSYHVISAEIYAKDKLLSGTFSFDSNGLKVLSGRNSVSCIPTPSATVDEIKKLVFISLPVDELSDFSITMTMVADKDTVKFVKEYALKKIPGGYISCIPFECKTTSDGIERYSYPKGFRESDIYTAKVNDRQVHVYKTAEPHIVSFGCPKDTPVQIELSSSQPIVSAIARPASKGYSCEVRGGRIILTAKAYDRIAVEVNGGESAPILVFVNPPEESPTLGDVVTLKRGKITSGTIELRDGQTLYVPGGAVLAGRVISNNCGDIKIIGNGIIDGTDDIDSSRRRPVHLIETDGIEMRGITVLNQTSWTVNCFECNNVLVDNIKIIATKSEVIPQGHQNDGFSIIGTDHMNVTRTFSYSHDDTYSIKTHKWTYGGEVTDVEFNDIVCWNEMYGHGLELGTGLDKNLSGVRWKNCYIINSGGADIPDVISSIGICHCASGTVKDVSYEDIYVENCRTRAVFIKMWDNGSVEDRDTYSPGHIFGIKFKNIHFDSKPPVKSVVRGYDDTHSASISIENMTFAGVKINESNISDYFIIGPYAEVKLH